MIFEDIGYMPCTLTSWSLILSVHVFVLDAHIMNYQGKYVTSRNLRDRLHRELEKNLAMRVEDGETADTFIISGRGTLHITILIESM